MEYLDFWEDGADFQVDSEREEIASSSGSWGVDLTGVVLHFLFACIFNVRGGGVVGLYF